MKGQFATCPFIPYMPRPVPAFRTFPYLCLVKSLPLIYGIYILCLSCIPCSDMNVCTDTSSSIDISAPAHDDHDHPNDLCSPFCICICCGMSITSSQVIPATFTDSYLTQNTCSNFHQHFIPEVYLNIWQPPKIG